MDFGDHLVDVVAELVDAGFLDGGDEDAGGLFFGDPAVLQLLERPVFGLFRLEGEFVVFLVLISVDFIEYDIYWFVSRFDRPGFTLELGRGKNPLNIEKALEIYLKAREMLTVCAIL